MGQVQQEGPLNQPSHANDRVKVNVGLERSGNGKPITESEVQRA